MSSDDLDYHRVRVREELDHAYRGTATAAVHAHFRLVALHMNRVDKLIRKCREACVGRASSAQSVGPEEIAASRALTCR